MVGIDSLIASLTYDYIFDIFLVVAVDYRFLISVGILIDCTLSYF